MKDGDLHSGDELLRQLGREAQRQEAASSSDAALTDKEQEDLASGRLPEERVAELRARAEGDPKLRAMLDALQPADDSHRQRLVELAVGAPVRTGGEPIRDLPDAKPAAARGSFRRRWPWGVAAAVVAACALVFMVRPDPLPDYELHVPGWRGTTDASSRVVDPHATVEIALSPEHPVRDELALRVYLVSASRVHRVPARVETSPSGELNAWLGGRAPLPPGEWSIVAIVALDGRMPSERKCKVIATRGADRGRTWVAVSGDPLVVESAQ